MKVAFVSPRWGPEIKGGAETAARHVAERLATFAGWQVEVFTSCALDHLTWASELPAGTAEVNGVTVHRFACAASTFGDDPSFAARVIRRPRAATLEEAQRWVRMQGPTSDELVDAVAGCDADVVVLTPYLFSPAVFSVPLLEGRSVLAPAAHDEPLLRLPAYRDTFRSAAGFVYYADEERVLVEQTFHVGSTPNCVTGIGVERHQGPSDPALVPADLGDVPFLVALGRVEEAKGSPLLARYFEVFKQRNPGPLKLVLAGPPSQPERYQHPDVVLAGAVSESVKWALLDRALAFVSPSPYESFSIVLMEAWLARRPALVNARSAVTRGHAHRSGGGLAFGDYPTFEAALLRLQRDPGLAAGMGVRGEHYAASRYAWPAVMARYVRFLEAFSRRN